MNPPAKAMHFCDMFESIVRPPSLEIGKLLPGPEAKNAQNPNVEVLCLALQPTPLTRQKYEERLGDKKAIRCQWLVVRVGPPGFSSAPYKPGNNKAGNKSAQKEQTESLYTANEAGETVFRAWTKTRNNMERGPVCADESMHAVLPHGSVVTNYLYPEQYAEGDVLCGNHQTQHLPHALQVTGGMDVIPKNTFVLIEIKAMNDTRAQEGQLLQIRKIVPLVDGFVTWNMLHGVPSNKENAKELQRKLRDDDAFKAIRKITENFTESGAVYVHKTLTRSNFWSAQQDTTGSAENNSPGAVNMVVSSEQEEWQDMVASSDVMQAFFKTTKCTNMSLSECIRVLDILTACGALHIVYRTMLSNSKPDDIMYIGINEQILTTVDILRDVLHSDKSPMFDNTIPIINGQEARVWRDEYDACVLSTPGCTAFLWALRDVQYPSDSSDTVKQLVFRARYLDDEQSDSEGSSSAMASTEVNKYQVLTMQKPGAMSHLEIEVWIVEMANETSSAAGFDPQNLLRNIFQDNGPVGVLPFGYGVDSNETDALKHVRKVMQFYCKRREGPKAAGKRKRVSY